MTRVALVCDWFLPRMGGIELHLRDLALALRARGLDARIVTTTRGPDEVDGVPVHRVPAWLSPVGGFAYTPRALASLAEVIRGEGFDVVHAHASVVSPVAYAGALAGARANLPTILTFHSMLHRSAFLLGASEALFGWARGRIVLSAVSSVVAAQAARWIPDAGIAVLPNGIDTSFWRARRPAPSGADVRFVSAMRLSRKKRPASLLRAFVAATRLANGAPPLRLVIAGDGPDRIALSRYAAELGIADRVELPGQLSRDQLRTLYASAHAFILPSERESFGIAALEARAAGLPVVAMLASGARDFIRQGVEGVLARDEPELGRAIGRLALDAPFRAYVAAHNASTVPEYDWRDVAALHEQIYTAASGARVAADRASQR
ncbi:MAG TPA: glycosyltransferase family 4 protein [Gemmatimonadaceae bacterium]|nr:glycosyltransferase family 4 protein [Gemmatimonadaceae bacterium]